jgi:hypothetical protein
VSFAQGAIDHRPDTIRIAEHFVIPEANNAISLILNDCRACRVHSLIVLAAIDFDHELRSVTCEISDEVSQCNLFAEVMLGEAFAQHSPHRSFSRGHHAAQASSTLYSAGWRMMLQALRPTTNITPP